MCDKAVGEHERFEIRPDGRLQLVTGNGPHPWGSDVRIKVSNGHGPLGSADLRKVTSAWETVVLD
jgi:hypothetical protein